MAIIVQKFGGTSVGDSKKIQNVADRVVQSIKDGDQIVVVVSAMAGVTNQLASFCAGISDLNSESKLAEYDVALSSGEVVTAALLALALQQRGVDAQSLLGWQLPIKTSHSFSKSLVQEIDSELLIRLLDSGITPVIAGFQGVNSDGRVTTLGRGGSDTTAAAISASIKADYCDIYTDVEGVFTADPRLVPLARKIDLLSYQEMLEFADMGAKVLHSRAVQIAMRYDFPIRVMSSFLNALGTTITKHSKNMESPKIIGIAHNKNIVLTDFKFKDYKAMEDLFAEFAENDIHVESINRDTQSFVECIIQLGDIAKVQAILDRSPDITYNIRTDIAIVSIIGFSLKNDTSIFSKVLSSLARDGIEIMSMMSSQIKLSIMVPEPATERAVKILHGLLIC